MGTGTSRQPGWGPSALGQASGMTATPSSTRDHPHPIPSSTKPDTYIRLAGSNQPTNRKPKRLSCPPPIVRCVTLLSLGIPLILTTSSRSSNHPLPSRQAVSGGCVSSAFCLSDRTFLRPSTPLERIPSVALRPGSSRAGGQYGYWSGEGPPGGLRYCPLPATINRVASSHHHQ